jgi:hypothetical protein
VSRDTLFNLWNLAAYQLAWFAVILGAARGFAWAGMAVALLVIGAHLALRPRALELKLIALAAAIGIMIDSTLSITGQVRFAAPGPVGLAPLWMLCLWMAFATTLNYSLRWLMRRPVAAALGGAIGGPLAYLAGARLGALELATPAITLSLIALLWVSAMVTFSMIVMRAAILPETGRLPA